MIKKPTTESRLSKRQKGNNSKEAKEVPVIIRVGERWNKENGGEVLKWKQVAMRPGLWRLSRWRWKSLEQWRPRDHEHRWWKRNQHASEVTEDEGKTPG